MIGRDQRDPVESRQNREKSKDEKRKVIPEQRVTKKSRGVERISGGERTGDMFRRQNKKGEDGYRLAGRGGGGRVKKDKK